MTKREAIKLRACRLFMLPIERVMIARTMKFVPPAKSVLGHETRNSGQVQFIETEGPCETEKYELVAD